MGKHVYSDMEIFTLIHIVLKKRHTLRLYYTFVMPCITLELC